MTKAYSEVIERMKRIARLKNYSSVARSLDVTPQALSNYKKRGKIPSHLVIKFAMMHGLSIDWLLTGEGNSYKEGMEEGSAFFNAREDEREYGKKINKSMDFVILTSDEMIYVGKLVRLLRSSNKSTRAALKCSIDAFLKSYILKDKG
jgi:hypothetical protein